MTKKSFTTAAAVGIILASTLITFAQSTPFAGKAKISGTISSTPSSKASLTYPKGKGLQLPGRPLSPEVIAYNTLSSTQALVTNLNVLIQQGELTFCPAQIAVLAQAVYPLGNAATQLDTAVTEYNNQILLPRAQRDWTYFWLLVNAAFSDFQEASGYYDQAVQTTC